MLSICPTEILEFAELYKKIYADVPLVVVPTSFNMTKENQLRDAGFSVVIYANNMLRASVPAMRKVAESILENERSAEVESEIEDMKSILNLIPGTN